MNQEEEKNGQGETKLDLVVAAKTSSLRFFGMVDSAGLACTGRPDLYVWPKTWKPAQFEPHPESIRHVDPVRLEEALHMFRNAAPTEPITPDVAKTWLPCNASRETHVDAIRANDEWRRQREQERQERQDGDNRFWFPLIQNRNNDHKLQLPAVVFTSVYEFTLTFLLLTANSEEHFVEDKKVRYCGWFYLPKGEPSNGRHAAVKKLGLFGAGSGSTSSSSCPNMATWIGGTWHFFRNKSLAELFNSCRDCFRLDISSFDSKTKTVAPASARTGARTFFYSKPGGTGRHGEITCEGFQKCVAVNSRPLLRRMLEFIPASEAPPLETWERSPDPSLVVEMVPVDWISQPGNRIFDLFVILRQFFRNHCGQQSSHDYSCIRQDLNRIRQGSHFLRTIVAPRNDVHHAVEASRAKVRAMSSRKLRLFFGRSSDRRRVPTTENATVYFISLSQLLRPIARRIASREEEQRSIVISNHAASKYRTIASQSASDREAPKPKPPPQQQTSFLTDAQVSSFTARFAAGFVEGLDSARAYPPLSNRRSSRPALPYFPVSSDEELARLADLGWGPQQRF